MTNKNNPLAPSWLQAPKDLNQVNQKIWPNNFSRADTGEIRIAGVPVGELAASYGTPLMVIDEQDFKDRAKETKAAFDKAAKKIGTSAKVYYAGKCLLNTEVVRWVSELGLNIDVSTGGELSVALAGGIDPARIGLHGNNKSLYEIGRAVTAGVGAIVIDSEIEIERIASVAGAQDKVLIGCWGSG